MKQEIINWLLEQDPSIKWQVMRDLLKAPSAEYLPVRDEVANSGWGKKLLDLQDISGRWGGGIYSPKWISTTYTMLLLKRLGLNPEHEQPKKSISLLIEKGRYKDGGINYFASLDHSETCVTGMILGLASYFRFSSDYIPEMTKFLLNQQMPDGGWNCQSFRGAAHSSMHTTISVLEGLLELRSFLPEFRNEAENAAAKAHEFLLQHRLFKSDKTGKVIKDQFTRLSFPPRWRYDILRALDYFRIAGAAPDERMEEATDLIRKKEKNGRWPLQAKHPGRTFFEMEEPGKPSAWNTLRALRILGWYENNQS